MYTSHSTDLLRPAASYKYKEKKNTASSQNEINSSDPQKKSN